MEVWEFGETVGLRPDGSVDDGEARPQAAVPQYDRQLLEERSRARLEGRPLPPLPPPRLGTGTPTLPTMTPPIVAPEG